VVDFWAIPISQVLEIIGDDSQVNNGNSGIVDSSFTSPWEEALRHWEQIRLLSSTVMPRWDSRALVTFVIANKVIFEPTATRMHRTGIEHDWLTSVRWSWRSFVIIDLYTMKSQVSLVHISPCSSMVCPGRLPHSNLLQNQRRASSLVTQEVSPRFLNKCSNTETPYTDISDIESANCDHEHPPPHHPPRAAAKNEHPHNNNNVQFCIRIPTIRSEIAHLHE
jgi:hypothetical protein